MRVGEGARAVGISTRWLLELERRGLIGPFARDINNHRRLSPEDVERIRAVVHRAPQASTEAVAR